MYGPSLVAEPDSRSRPLTVLQQVPLELGILKTFEFVSQLRRASVVVRQFGSTAGNVYVKGAPECMQDICRPESCKLSTTGSSESRRGC